MTHLFSPFAGVTFALILRQRLQRRSLAGEYKHKVSNNEYFHCSAISSRDIISMLLTEIGFKIGRIMTLALSAIVPTLQHLKPTELRDVRNP
jgi:hypothetical protein